MIDLAEQHPDTVEEMKALWLEEAEKYNVLPVNDMTMHELRHQRRALPRAGPAERPVHVLPQHL